LITAATQNGEVVSPKAESVKKCRKDNGTRRVPEGGNRMT